jgi:hypothetical protein
MYTYIRTPPSFLEKNMNRGTERGRIHEKKGEKEI